MTVQDRIRSFTSESGHRWECWIVFDVNKYEQAWRWVDRCSGWMSTHPLGIMFWLPSQDVWYLRMLDSSAEAYPERDYIG